MVKPVDDEEENLLEDMFFPTDYTNRSADHDSGIPQKPEQSAFEDEPQDERDAALAAQKFAAAAESDSSDGEESDELECDPDGAVAICEECAKVMPQSKYEKHQAFYCKKKTGECPMCFLKFPMTLIQQHIQACDLVQVDPDLVTCKFCKARMLKKELADHSIAHIVHQKQVEHQIVTRVADIEDFFEEEKLESTVNKAPCMTKQQLVELPCSEYLGATSNDQKDSENSKCTVCQLDFEVGDNMRTLRCLHIFHKDCIDKWLMTVTGSCVNCKVIQIRPESPTAVKNQATDNAIRRAAADERHPIAAPSQNRLAQGVARQERVVQESYARLERASAARQAHREAQGRE